MLFINGKQNNCPIKESLKRIYGFIVTQDIYGDRVNN